MNYLSRRRELLNKIDDGIIILFSGYEIHASSDEAYPFEVNRNFYYLTGINQDDCYLILSKDSEKLYLRKNDEVLAKWVGYSLFPNQAKEISSINTICFNDLINEELKLVALNNKKVYLDLEKTSFLGGVNQGKRIKELLLSYNPDLEICDIYQEIIKLRMVKDDDEILALEKSIDITRQSLESVMKNLKNFTNEKQCQAHFEERISSLGHAVTSFATIAASGKNAAILHYTKNNQEFKNEDMILMDLGACVNFYRADITRTYPHFGRYSSLQKQIYQLVLNCNKKIIDIIKPGITIKELQLKTIEYLSEGLLKLNIISKKEEISKYYFHNISHHLGLDTHDPSLREMPLVEGNVITVEPGLYLEHLNIGVRIEDDVLVTSNGSRNLSKNIIKEVDDIEDFILNAK